MKKINTGFVVDPTIQQPFTTKSLDFLQMNSKEMIYAICRNLVTMSGRTYSPTVPYFIAQNNMGIITSDGFIFFNDELYVLDENTASLPYLIVDTTADATYDPLLFTDNVSRNVHNNRRLTFTSTLAGSLFADADVVDIKKPLVVSPLVAQLLTTVTGITSVDYVVKFASETSDVDGINNTTTGVITPIKAGIYNVNTSVVLDNFTSAGFDISLSIIKNGVLYKNLQNKSTDNFFPIIHLNGNYGIYCNGTTDYFTINVGLDGSTAHDLIRADIVVNKIG